MAEEGFEWKRQVRLVYHSSSHPEPQPRNLDPYTLVYRWVWWYVIGYYHLRQYVRYFRVDRIIELAISSQILKVL